MNPIDLSLPKSVRVSGELLDDYSQCPEWLTQDILQVYLPNGQTIDVGWSPEFDLNGRFQVVVCDHGWNNQIEGPAFIKDPFWVANYINEIVNRRLSIRRHDVVRSVRFVWPQDRGKVVNVEQMVQAKC